jgi:hypothetical protein
LFTHALPIPSNNPVITAATSTINGRLPADGTGAHGGASREDEDHKRENEHHDADLAAQFTTEQNNIAGKCFHERLLIKLDDMYLKIISSGRMQNRLQTRLRIDSFEKDESRSIDRIHPLMFTSPDKYDYKSVCF